jgi:tRNA threonylcarbamoyl adenosine modification protein (Sua5/YciO/YrdC/YwlC family)
MAQFFTLHPANPQLRLIRTAVEIIKAGGIIAYPTDSSYALGCHIGDAKALDKIRAIRQVGDEHNFTLVCADLSELGKYARIDNQDYRTIKRLTPGPYTFILPATREVPRRLQNPKRKTIGLRVPDYPIVTALLDTLGEPIMSSTLLLPGAILPLNDAFEIEAAVGNQIDLVIDGGSCDINPTTVLGKGDISFL